jgi:hypothetical protein
MTFMNTYDKPPHMPETPRPAAKKTATPSALRCLNEQCRALLAYEVDANNVLYVDLAWTARHEGDLAFFPCPSCKGKNIVEAEVNEKGVRVHRVTRWQR